MMSEIQPNISTIDGHRVFACFPAAVLAILIDPRERFLLLSHPKRKKWEVVNGALEAGETILDGALREIAEEAGTDLRVEPLGLIHIENFHYDKNVRYMFSISYLMKYIGGLIESGDDMEGSNSGWFTLEEVEKMDEQILVPVNGIWQFERALDLFRSCKDKPIPPLQPELLWPPKNKYHM